MYFFKIFQQQGIESAPLFPILGSNEMPSRSMSRTSSHPNDNSQDRVKREKSPYVEATSSDRAQDTGEAVHSPREEDEMEDDEEEEEK